MIMYVFSGFSNTGNVQNVHEIFYYDLIGCANSVLNI